MATLRKFEDLHFDLYGKPYDTNPKNRPALHFTVQDNKFIVQIIKTIQQPDKSRKITMNAITSRLFLDIINKVITSSPGQEYRFRIKNKNSPLTIVAGWDKNSNSSDVVALKFIYGSDESYTFMFNYPYIEFINGSISDTELSIFYAKAWLGLLSMALDYHLFLVQTPTINTLPDF